MWLYASAAIWTATLVPAALVALAGPGTQALARQLLEHALTPAHNPRPNLGRVVVFAAHNIPIACWPLLLGAYGAHRTARARRRADRLLLVCLLVNVVPVGVVLGGYGTALLPYIPQLPVEWSGLAIGASSWLVQRRRPLTPREAAGVFLLATTALLCAAVLETVAVPHR